MIESCKIDDGVQPLWDMTRCKPPGVCIGTLFVGLRLNNVGMHTYWNGSWSDLVLFLFLQRAKTTLKETANPPSGNKKRRLCLSILLTTSLALANLTTQNWELITQTPFNPVLECAPENTMKETVNMSSYGGAQWRKECINEMGGRSPWYCETPYLGKRNNGALYAINCHAKSVMKSTHRAETVYKINIWLTSIIRHLLIRCSYAGRRWWNVICAYHI